MEEKLYIQRKNLYVVGVVLLLSLLAVAFLKPVDAHAKTMRLGDYLSLSHYYDYSYLDDCENVTVKSSNKKVASVYKSGIYSGVSIIGFGKATVKFKWKYKACEYYDGEWIDCYYDQSAGKYVDVYHHHDSSCYKVCSKKIKIKAKKAKVYYNGIFTGKKFSIITLLNYGGKGKIMSKQKSGKFKNGKGYVVTDEGKKIKFIKTGKKVVKYKYKKKTYKIYVESVHSVSKLKKAAIKQIKENLYYPPSFKLVKTKFDKKTNTLEIKYDEKNMFGAGHRATVHAFYSGNDVYIY